MARWVTDSFVGFIDTSRQVWGSECVRCQEVKLLEACSNCGNDKFKRHFDGPVGDPGRYNWYCTKCDLTLPSRWICRHCGTNNPLEPFGYIK